MQYTRDTLAMTINHHTYAYSFWLAIIWYSCFSFSRNFALNGSVWWSFYAMTSLQKILLLVLVVVPSQSDTQERAMASHILTGMPAIPLMVHVWHGIFVMNKNSVSVVIVGLIMEWYVTMRISVQLYWAAAVWPIMTRLTPLLLDLAITTVWMAKKKHTTGCQKTQ